MSYQSLLVLPHLKIHNANALSSPYTIGFPAMTAWLGAVHALQRKLHQQGFENVSFKRVGVMSHHFNLQTYQGPGDFVHSIIGTANPVDKDGKRPAFIEEARCHLEVSLLIEYQGDSNDEDAFKRCLVRRLQNGWKIAGGDILTFDPPYLTHVEQYNPRALRKAVAPLLPGYALIERRDLMQQAMDEGQDALDALIDYLSVHYQYDTEQQPPQWQSSRLTSGWIVPIAVGYQGVSPLGEAKNQRDPDIPHRFAESVVTLGEFKMPHRLNQLDEMLWGYQTDLNHDLYLCETQFELPEEY